jgi:predicted amidohydrolase YtcJ
MRSLPLAILAAALAACAPATVANSPQAPAQAAFWRTLRGLCGRAFTGTVVEAPAGDTTFAGKPLVMHVRQCDGDTVRIPFHVGENRSRTWVLTRTASGLRLKHDHRHEDGSEDPVTQYGGDTRGAGTATRQEFPADAHTASLIPAAATNVWTVEVVPGERFTYALRREGTDRRFRIDFDLRRPVTPPPPPWAASPAPASLVVVNARVWTGDPARPEAQALAVRGGRIAAVGTDAEIRRLAGPETRVVDAAGGMLVPGFIDTHVHFIDGGFRLASVQLRDARTPREFVARIRDFARTVPPGTWITGGDWDHEQWGGELPRAEWIDSVTPHHPVWVNRLDGHMALANTAALRAAGVTRKTPEVAGGSIVRGANGEPAGVFKDNAMGVVDRVVPTPSDEMNDRALDAAMRHVAAQGVTSVHNMGSWSDLAAFRRAHAAGRLRTRVYAAVPLPTWERLRDTVTARGRGDAWLRIGGLKGFVDGSLGSHTAAFHQPFTDTPGDRGLLVSDPDSLYRWTSGADRAGLHVLVHAIGDRAIGLQLNVFDRVARENGARDRRFRIEHAQHVAPRDMARFAALGVIPSMQPYHAIDDGRWAEKVIGPERIRTTYAFRSLVDAGARLAFGSDWFVAPPTPLEGIYAAVTRRTLDGRNPGGWVPEQKITVEEALRAYTRDAAYASFEEEEKGVLAPGKLADFVLLDRDLRAIPPETIRDAKVRLTVVDGRVVFEGEAK